MREGEIPQPLTDYLDFMSTWFDTLTGFAENETGAIERNLKVFGKTLISTHKDQSYQAGWLETPRLLALRERVQQLPPLAKKGMLQVREVVADVQNLHLDPAHAGAFFQAASQFNLLEMVGPNVPPEEGVGIYEDDHTQGPACAIACGAGTIYRNYFVPVNGQKGQTAYNQIDCLADMGAALDNARHQYWRMQNGYVIFTETKLRELQARLTAPEFTERERDHLRAQLQIGLQWDTEVTLQNKGHLVTQAYCSALPVSYNRHPVALWEPIARLVLEASYEATLCAAVLNYVHTGNASVFLTLVGGGVFGNREDWIFDSLQRALNLFADYPLDIAMVSYGQSHPRIKELKRGK